MDKTKKKIALALFVAMFLAAFEGTVVATAAPVIAKDLSGFALVSWIFSLYLLTSALSTPIYGKLADLYGRKNVLSCGITVFLLGSLLCGFSQNMYQLVAFRALQGLGAGSILTVSFTVIGDVYTLKERSIVQGGISTVWGIAGLIGPLLGGFLIDILSWHWIFFINVPFALLCVLVLQTHLKNPTPQKKPQIDYAGTVALSTGLGAFLYGIMIGYNNGEFAYSMAAAALSLFIFYHIERRAPEPIIPLSLLTRNACVINGITFFSSVLLIATTVYLPLYIQSVLGYSATIAGLALASMSISWFAGSVTLARAMEKFGPRKIVIASAFTLMLSAWLLTTLTADCGLAAVSFYAFVFGFGFSGTLNTLTFMVQDSVGYERRGAAVGLNTLTRILSQAVGVSFFGTVINVKLTTYFQERNMLHVDINDLAAPLNALSAIEVRDALFSALHFVFIALIAAAAVAAVIALFLPRKETNVPHNVKPKKA